MSQLQAEVLILTINALRAGILMSDPFATVPVVAAIVYLVVFGFGHWWYVAGFIVWAAGSTVTKLVNIVGVQVAC